MARECLRKQHRGEVSQIWLFGDATAADLAEPDGELLFSDVLRPDFTGEQLQDAVESFRGRERRFGALLDRRDGGALAPPSFGESL